MRKLLLLLLVISCSRGSNSLSDYLETYADVAIQPRLITTVNESDDFLFSDQMGSLTVDSKGNLFIVDRKQNHVVHFTPDGRVAGTFGRAGDGPGEFRSMTNSYVARDTLYVFDVNLARLTSMRLNASNQLEMANAMDIRLPEGRIPRGVLMSSNHYVIEGFDRLPDGSQEGFIALLNRDGSVYNPKMMPLKVPESKTISMSGMTIFAPTPFRRRSHYRLTPDDVFHYAWNDSARIEQYDINGNRIGTVRVDVGYRQADKSEVILNNYPPETQSQILENLHPTKPAFDNFHVDETGKIFLNLGNMENPETDKWLILDAQGNLLKSFNMARAITFFQIRNNTLYGIQRMPDTSQQIVVYSVADLL